MSERCIIAGSRDLKDYSLIEKAVQDSGFEIVTAISGGQWGADKLGERWADNRSIPKEVYEANWKRFGRKAGPLRNEQMAKVATACIIVWNGRSPGSASMKWYAQLYNLKLHELIVEV